MGGQPLRWVEQRQVYVGVSGNGFVPFIAAIDRLKMALVEAQLCKLSLLRRSVM